MFIQWTQFSFGSAKSGDKFGSCLMSVGDDTVDWVDSTDTTGPLGLTTALVSSHCFTDSSITSKLRLLFLSCISFRIFFLWVVCRSGGVVRVGRSPPDTLLMMLFTSAMIFDLNSWLKWFSSKILSKLMNTLADLEYDELFSSSVGQKQNHLSFNIFIL